jgi:hypothetical protein
VRRAALRDDFGNCLDSRNLPIRRKPRLRYDLAR